MRSALLFLLFSVARAQSLLSRNCLNCWLEVEEDDDDEEANPTYLCNTGRDQQSYPDSTFTIDLSPDFVRRYSYKMPGWFCVDNGKIDAENGRIIIGNGRIRPQHEEDGDEMENMIEPKVGIRTVLVVRVFGNSAPLDMSFDETIGQIFSLGPEARINSIATQYSKCSAGKLDLVPLEHPAVDHGVLDLDYGDDQLAGRELNGDYSFRNELGALVHNALGVDDLSQAVDHVMYILPDSIKKKGVAGTWGAFASYYRSFYRTVRARKLSTTMHEIGHNLKLKHAGENGNAYGDKSSYMGSSSSYEDRPVQCFNAANHYQLGWFDDRVVNVNTEYQSWSGNLVSFVDYKKARPEDAVIIKMDDTVFLQYNRAKEHNFENREKRDEVVITEQENFKATSWVLTSLVPGQHYDLKTVRITFCRATTSTNGADNAVLSIGRIGTTAATCPPVVTKKPTKKPTKSQPKLRSKPPTKRPTTQRPSCLKFDLRIRMDDYPEEVSWRIVVVPQDDDGFASVVKQKSGYTVPGKTYREQHCLPSNHCYRFLIRDSGRDGLCCNYGRGRYVLRANNKVVSNRAKFKTGVYTRRFGNCWDTTT